MIRLEDFLARVREIDAEHPTYRSGGDGSDGTCDCIGLIIGAIRRAGGEWTGTHGSNYAARRAVDNFRQVSKAKDLNVGDVVFKAYEPSDSGYNLPAAYKNHYDLRDYYHIGVVSSVVPLVIIHCTTPTTKHDNALGKWRYAGRLIELKFQDYDRLEHGWEGDGVGALYQAEVVTQTDPLRVRDAPETGRIIGHVPKGKFVDVLEAGSWPLIRYNELEGYASGTYLTRVSGDSGASGADGGVPAGTGGVVTIPRELAAQLYSALGDALNVD